MAMQTWLVLLLCIFFFSISVYSFISYLKDRRRQKFTSVTYTNLTLTTN
ncbi:small membrane protein [Klebsiella pneumoniae]|nr:small membrane protein [Klebsiella pneumoniae]MDK9465982.1 small membrane protein [Klebsiella pneumoniae]